MHEQISGSFADVETVSEKFLGGVDHFLVLENFLRALVGEFAQIFREFAFRNVLQHFYQHIFLIGMNVSLAGKHTRVSECARRLRIGERDILQALDDGADADDDVDAEFFLQGLSEEIRIIGGGGIFAFLFAEIFDEHALVGTRFDDGIETVSAVLSGEGNDLVQKLGDANGEGEASGFADGKFCHIFIHARGGAFSEQNAPKVLRFREIGLLVGEALDIRGQKDGVVILRFPRAFERADISDIFIKEAEKRIISVIGNAVEGMIADGSAVRAGIFPVKGNFESQTLLNFPENLFQLSHAVLLSADRRKNVFALLYPKREKISRNFSENGNSFLILRTFNLLQTKRKNLQKNYFFSIDISDRK